MIAEKMGARCHVGNVISSNVFYDDDACVSEDMSAVKRWASMGVLAVEMEAAALYMNAARSGKEALALLTISDSLVTGEALPTAERQESFDEMMIIALKTAVKLEGE